MLNVEDTWRQHVYPWFLDNPKLSHMGDWGTSYCFNKLLQAIKENTAELPVIQGLLSKSGTRITYYFLAVEDPEYERWQPICFTLYDDFLNIYSCSTPCLIRRKRDKKLGYLDEETLEFNPQEDISRFIWAAGLPENTPIRVIDKKQTYISILLKKARKVYTQSISGVIQMDYFAKDVLGSSAHLLPHWGSQKLFLAHLPIRAELPEWATLDEDKIPEKEIQQDLVQWLESSGHTVEIHPQISNKGIPDLLINNKTLVEVKNDLGTRTARYAIGQVQGYSSQYIKAIAGPVSGADLKTIKNACISVYLQLEPGNWLFIENT